MYRDFWCQNSRIHARNANTLFLLSISDTKHNARSLLTPVSNPAFQAPSHGCFFDFALLDTFLNHFLLVKILPTAKQNLEISGAALENEMQAV